MDYTIAVVKIGNREGSALAVQKVLTENGCLIKVRLGLHDMPTDACSPLGVVIMQLVGKTVECKAMVDALNAIPEVVARLVKV